jgi:hypothetical protein
VEAEQLERFVIEELKARSVAPLADCQTVYELRVAQPAKFRSMSIDQLGAFAGASQVLYINLELSATDVGQNSEVYKGQGAALVRVVDVSSGQTVWPDEGSDGYPVRQDAQLVRLRPGVTEASVRRQIQQGLAIQIVQQFYKYKPD